MKIISSILIVLASCFLNSCGFSNKTTTPTEPKVQRIPAKFDFSPPSREKPGATKLTIAIVKPIYLDKHVQENPEYFVPPFNEMAESMGNDFEELLTAKGFTVRGPFGSRDEMVYNDKLNSNIVMEIGIKLSPQMFNRKYTRYTHSPSFGELLANKNAPTTSTYKMSGEITLSGSLIIAARSPEYGELIWKKNIALEPQSFTYNGQEVWSSLPNVKDELSHDNVVYNKLSTELEKFYMKALDLTWRQIDPDEIKIVARQAKEADDKSK